MSTVVRLGLKRVFNVLYGSKYLFVTNTVSSGVLMAFGDVIVQRIEHFTQIEKQRKNNDWSRTGRLFTVGIFLGPCNHGWYTFLDKVLPATRLLVVGKKILMDQIIAAPILAFGFFMGTNLLAKIPAEKSWDEFRRKFWTVYMMDWMVWPAAQAVNFLFLAPRFRVLYVSVITTFWDSFLSYIKHKDIKEKDGKDAGA